MIAVVLYTWLVALFILPVTYIARRRILAGETTLTGPSNYIVRNTLVMQQLLGKGYRAAFWVTHIVMALLTLMIDALLLTIILIAYMTIHQMLLSEMARRNWQLQ